MATDSPTIKPEHVQVLAEHYQKTFELADGLRRDRNRFFIFLVVVLAGASVFFSLGKEKALKMLAAWMSASMNFDKLNQTQYSDLSPDAIAKLLLDTNFALLLALTLAVVFYLMMNLYHHTATVKRLYAYLHDMEKEIGNNLVSNAKITSFTREGDFYESHNPFALRLIGLAYSIVLTILLGSFFFLVRQDLQFIVHLDNPPLTAIKIADVIIAVATLAFLAAYWRASFKFSDFFKSKPQSGNSQAPAEMPNASQ